MSDFRRAVDHADDARAIRSPTSEIRHPSSVLRADLALAFNTLIWGSTFVMVKRALDDASALLYVAIRFLVATCVLAWVFRKRWSLRSAPARGGVVAGICLFAGYAFQTVGLKLTTPSKAAFLTGLAVVMVP